jgi:hypothetical protein
MPLPLQQKSDSILHGSCYINPEWSPHVSRPAVWGLFKLLQTLTKKHFIQLTTYRLLLTIIFGKIRQKKISISQTFPFIILMLPAQQENKVLKTASSVFRNIFKKQVTED